MSANILDDLIEHATAVKAREASSYAGSNYSRSAYHLAERVLEIVFEARALTQVCVDTGTCIVFSSLNDFKPVRQPNSARQLRSKRNGRSKTKK